MENTSEYHYVMIKFVIYYNKKRKSEGGGV